MLRLALPSIHHNKAGFEALVGLHAKAIKSSLINIEIDMRNVTWFDGDMCSAFGAILYKLRASLKNVKLINIPPVIDRILSKNGFLSFYGEHEVPDNWGTTISYKKFDIQDIRIFIVYIEKEFINRPEMPVMSDEVKKRFQIGLFEIFNNAVTHSHTTLGIFSCGQFFPHRHQLDFSVTDLGIGMRQNIKNVKGMNLTPEEAIEWATSEFNTTKIGGVPGGLGLKILTEFIDLNGGCLRIVSDAGYWERRKGKIHTERLSESFPGTVVSIEIDTADTKSYRLSNELSPADIF